MKRVLGLLLALTLAVCAAGCSVKEKKTPLPGAAASSAAAAVTTRVPNSFKETLPEFEFDGAITENYDEGLRYTFSAPCSEKTFQKYQKALEKAGYKEKPTSGTGYYAATLASGMRVEAVLKGGRVTVSVKRVNNK